MRSIIRYTAIAIAFWATLSCSILQKAPDDEAILFSVDGVPVSAEEFRYVYEKNNYDNEKLYSEEDVRDYLDLFIRFKLKVHEAKELGYDTAASFIDEYQTYRKQLAGPLLTETKFQERLIEEAYERMQYEVRASHILIRLPKNALPEDTLKAYSDMLEIRGEAVSGEDFNMLAKKYSQDPSARTNGGDLGYFSAFQMVYPFETAAYTTDVGEISEIIRSTFGYHIVRVTDKRPSPGKVKVAHILLRVQPDRSDSATVANKAFEVYDQIVAGAEWDNMCARYSEDTRTRQNGGSLPYLTHGQIDPLFMEVAFSIPETGGISDPFMTRYGWHILKLEDRQEIGTLGEMRKEIEPKVRRDERLVLSRSKMLAQLKEKLAVETHEVAKEYVIGRADSTLLKGKWVFDERQHSLDDTLFTTINAGYSMRAFFEYVQENQRPRQNISPEGYMRELYQDFVYHSLLEDEMNELSERDADFRFLLKEYYEGILLFNIMEDMVWSKAASDSAALRAFFDRNRSMFMWGDRANATMYKASSPTVIDSIARHFSKEDTIVLKTFYLNTGDLAAGRLKEALGTFKDTEELLYLVAAGGSGDVRTTIEKLLVESGADNASVVHTGTYPERGDASVTVASTSKKSLEWIFNRESPLTLEVREGVFERGDYDVLNRITWKPGAYTVSDSRSFHLVVVQSVRPPEQKDFDAVKGSVISAYQDYLEKEWLETLKAKFPVEINNRVLNKLF